MNYTRLKLIQSLLVGLEGGFPSDWDDDKAAKMSEYIAQRRIRASLNAETDVSLRSSQGEWEFIDFIQQISESENISDTVRNIRDQLSGKFREGCAPRIKIIFFVQEFSLWASYRTIYDFFNSRDDCDVALVYAYSKGRLPELGKQENIKMFEGAGYHVVDMADFDFYSEEPDIIFYQKPYFEGNGIPAKYYIEEIAKHVKYTVFISYCLDVQGGDRLYKFFYGMPMFYRAWKVVAYSNHYYEMLKRYSYCDGENLIRFGHPKFDALSEIMNNDSLKNDCWEKVINNRRTVMWNSHFSVGENVGVGTFFENYKTMFGYFEKNQDVVLIWRPHPYFWEMVQRDPRMDKGDFDSLLLKLNKMDNVIIDKSGDYRTAFYYADALVSDAATFLVEFGMSGKPVMYTPKKNGESIINEAYLKNVEICFSAADLVSFLDEIVSAVDLGGHQPANLIEEFGVCDGNNGRKIGTYVLDAVKEDIGDYWNKLLF